jgi:hypothetical protein
LLCPFVDARQREQTQQGNVYVAANGSFLGAPKRKHWRDASGTCADADTRQSEQTQQGGVSVTTNGFPSVLPKRKALAGCQWHDCREPTLAGTIVTRVTHGNLRLFGIS